MKCFITNTTNSIKPSVFFDAENSSGKFVYINYNFLIKKQERESSFNFHDNSLFNDILYVQYFNFNFLLFLTMCIFYWLCLKVETRFIYSSHFTEVFVCV